VFEDFVFSWWARAAVFFLVTCLSSCSGAGSAPSSSGVPTGTAPVNIDWKDLIPPEEVENSRLVFAFVMRHINHDSEETPAQFGSFKTVAALEGRAVSLSGYVVPLDTDDQGLMSSFLFVPTIGACIHVPPPPPHQMVYVTLAHPIPTPEEGELRLLHGTLHTQTYDLQIASAAYSMHDADLAPSPLSDGP
jgi:hypothetical protein